MKIFEVESAPIFTPSPDQMLGLVEFLSGRADDQASSKQISQLAFINLAQSLGINVTKDNLSELVNQPPLSNVLEPLQPDTDEPIVFKGGEPAGQIEMPVNKAQDIVAKAAKSAANKDRSV